jgi:hypothetical protein
MINIQKRHCDVPDCRETPTHNFKGLKPLYCLAHADPSIGHVNVKYSARGSTSVRLKSAGGAGAQSAKAVGVTNNMSRKHSRDTADEDDQEAAYNRRLQYHQEQQQLQWQAQQQRRSSSASAYASSTEGTTAEHCETEGYDSGGSGSAYYSSGHRGATAAAAAAAAAGGSEDCFARRPAQRSCSIFSSDGHPAAGAARDRVSSTSSTETFHGAGAVHSAEEEEDAVAVRGIISLRHSPLGGATAIRRVTPAPAALLISSGRVDNNTSSSSSSSRRSSSVLPSAARLAAVEPGLSVPSPRSRSSSASQGGGAWTAPSLGQWFAPAAVSGPVAATGGTFDSRVLPSFRTGVLDSSRLLPVPVFETASVAVASLQQQQQERYPTINGLLQSLGLSNEVTAAASMRCTPATYGLHTGGAAQYF